MNSNSGKVAVGGRWPVGGAPAGTVWFYELANGARFLHHGKRFTKTGMSVGEDERRWGHVFLEATIVEPEGEPLLLPPEEAARWMPDYGPWNDFVEAIVRDGAKERGAQPSEG